MQSSLSFRMWSSLRSSDLCSTKLCSSLSSEHELQHLLVLDHQLLHGLQDLLRIWCWSVRERVGNWRSNLLPSCRILFMLVHRSSRDCHRSTVFKNEKFIAVPTDDAKLMMHKNGFAHHLLRVINNYSKIKRNRKRQNL